MRRANLLVSTRPGWFQHHPTHFRRERGEFNPDTTRRGSPLLSVFLSSQTRRGGDLPFSLSLYPHRRNEEGRSPSRRVSIHTDATRRDIHTPSHRVSIRTDTVTGGIPTRRQGVYPFSSFFYPHRCDEEGRSPPGGLTPPRHLLYYIFIYFNYNNYS